MLRHAPLRLLQLDAPRTTVAERPPDLEAASARSRASVPIADLHSRAASAFDGPRERVACAGGRTAHANRATPASTATAATAATAITHGRLDGGLGAGAGAGIRSATVYEAPASRSLAIIRMLRPEQPECDRREAGTAFRTDPADRTCGAPRSRTDTTAGHRGRRRCDPAAREARSDLVAGDLERPRRRRAGQCPRPAGQYDSLGEELVETQAEGPQLNQPQRDPSVEVELVDRIGAGVFIGVATFTKTLAQHRA
ncbi:hypothetical protein ACPPVO_34895 [Dactylosporangium sp. McL0621]|uniref:hypothetical protein n=1 Tax=Dactylosporangium sp. McL0621 TaxID=3415678 RepID=UPI003CF6F93B